MNPIYLRRRCRLLLSKTPPAGNGSDTPSGPVTAVELAAIQAQAEALGYLLSDAVLTCLAAWPRPSVTLVGRQLLKVLREMTGAHRQYRPLYPDFPKQVQDLSLIHI